MPCSTRWRMPVCWVGSASGLREHRATPGCGIPCDCDCSIPSHDPTCRPGHDGLILKPEESEVVDALGEVRFDDDVSGNHSARDVSIVGAIVTVCLGLRDRTDASDIRGAGYRVRAENVVDGTK